MKFWLSVLALLVAGAVGFVWMRRGKEADVVPLYRTATVTRGEIVQLVTATGQLSPLTTVEVGSEVSGRIAKRYVDFNDTVKTGQLLAEIDPASYQARVVQAQAQLDSARANYDLRKVTADRTAELRKNQLVSQSEYDQVMAELRQQEAAVRIAEANLKNAQLDLDRCKIYAPIDGVVISRDVDVGQTVQASFQAPKLFSIAQDLRRMEISAAVSEADIGGIEPGQPVEFEVDAYPDRKFTGVVRQVRANPTVEQNVVTYPTIITVDNDDLDLLPGMTANVRITTARRSNVLQVPNAALRFRPPEGAVVRTAETKPDRGQPDAEAGLTIDQVPGLENAPAEVRQRLFDRHDVDKDGRLNPTELAALQETRARFAAGGGRRPGEGGGGGFAMRGNGAPRPVRSRPTSERTVYVLATPPAEGMPGSGDLLARRVQIGITDGANTEILSGLEEGEVVAVGIIDADSAEARNAQPRNPFLPQFGRRRR